MGGVDMNGEQASIRPIQKKETFEVKVEFDSVTRDNPTTHVVSGVTTLDVNRNGDLLFYQGESFPTVGYTAGVWVRYAVKVPANESEWPIKMYASGMDS
jgi:hypothetical protein